MRRTWAHLFSLFGAGITLVATACGVDALDLAGHRCPCVGDFVCDTARNVCVKPSALTSDAGPEPCMGDGCSCTVAADCKDPAYPHCVQSKCVECTTNPDTCTGARYCLPTNTCAPGCKSDDDCKSLSQTSPFCNVERHQCVNCLNDQSCTNGQKCSPAGACVDSCANGSCTGGKQCCGGLCIDTTSDPLNCNKCGATCTGSQTQCCSGTCVDPLTTANNCGQCGVVCSTTNGTPSCSGGTCKWACAPGFAHCADPTANTGCETNTANDPQHCGSCRRNCNFSTYHASGIACANSACTYATCSAPWLDCDGNKANGCECTSPTCGAVGQPCCSGGRCNAGDIDCGSDNVCHN